MGVADCKKQRGVNCTKALDIAMEDCSNMDVLYDSSDTSDEEVIAKPSCKNPKAVEESEGAKAKREGEEAKGKISFATETLRVTEGSQQLLDIIAHFVKQLHQPKQTTVQTFSSHADLMDNLGVPVEDGENPMPVMFSFINFLGDPHVQQFVRLAGFPNEELDKICHVIENEMSTNLPAAMQLNDIVTTILKNYRGTVGNDNNAVQNLRSLLESLRQQAERDKLKWEALVLPGWLQLRQASFDSRFLLYSLCSAAAGNRCILKGRVRTPAGIQLRRPTHKTNIGKRLKRGSRRFKTVYNCKAYPHLNVF